MAKKIVEYRQSKGPFQNRSQLRTISGLGPKTFEQCAGFLRVLPETRNSANSPLVADRSNLCAVYLQIVFYYYYL